MKGVRSGERGEEEEEFIAGMSDEHLTILCCINVARWNFEKAQSLFFSKRIIDR